MSLRKHGTGEILPEDEDIKVQATKDQREQALAEVIEEDKRTKDQDEEKH